MQPFFIFAISNDGGVKNGNDVPNSRMPQHRNVQAQNYDDGSSGYSNNSYCSIPIKVVSALLQA